MKSTLCNLEYMTKVRNGTVYCPRHSEVRLLPCPAPPSKECLIKEILAIAQRKGLDLGISEMRAPNVQWMLTVLSTWDQGHKFFKKDYVPAQSERRHGTVQKVVDNADGFFD